MEHLNLSEAEWRRRLSPDQYRVLREAGPARTVSDTAFDHRADGLYLCAACRLDLFDSGARIDGGPGGLSFSAPIAPDRVTDHRDPSGSAGRVETRCARCDSHLGHHVDGRHYCLHGVALDFRARR